MSTVTPRQASAVAPAPAAPVSFDCRPPRPAMHAASVAADPQALPTADAIPAAFREVLARAPDGIALSCGSAYLSRAGLHRASDRLARVLRARGVEAEDCVAICAERSIDVIAGILAILKAGAAYLPLDPTYPRDRLHYMLTDSRARIVLVGEDQAGIFQSFGVQEIALRQPASDGAAAPFVASRIAPEQLAYVIYTSGSTGRPKGIMVPHRAVVNHVRWRMTAFGISADDAILQRTPLSFDVSVWELFGALLTGATLVVPPGGPHAGACLVDTMITRGVTSLDIVPSLLKIMLQEPTFGACRSLRYVFSAGELLPSDVAARCQMLLPATTVVNGYGPTETTVTMSAWPCSRGVDAGRLPIGFPMINTRVAVLDARIRPVPQNDEGTLFVAGACVARGYWGRPDLTAERFLPDAYTEGVEPGDRLYDTGDLVRLACDGALEFTGRRDTQVKVRGFRIELQEIEQVLKACPLVADGLVTLRVEPGGDKKLVCYYVLRASENSLELNAIRHTRWREVRDFLAAALPDYMIPHHFTNIDVIPLLPSGKVNTAGLPAPAYYVERDGATGPKNEKERVLHDVWCDVLGAPSVNCDDKFSWYGGDSLQMIEVRLLAQKRGLFVPPMVGNYSTVRRLASLAVWLEDARVSRKARAEEVLSFLRLVSRAKLFELRDTVRQWWTAWLERADRRRFRAFYEALPNKENIFYLFVRRGLLHCVAKQLAFVPEDVNVVIFGTAMTTGEQHWIRTHIKRPFFHAELEIDDNAAWEFLFDTTRTSFGWLEIGCFVNNSALFRELARIDDDVAVNCVYTYTERHRRLFMEYLLFVNARAIEALRAHRITAHASKHSFMGERRPEHRSAWLRVPRAHDRALVRQVLHDSRGGEARSLRGWLASQRLYTLTHFVGHLFYLHARPLGFRIKRVRHLTAPTDVGSFQNFFCDEVITALHLSRYESWYVGEKFAGDFLRTVQADYALLRSTVDPLRLPPAYARRLAELEAKIRQLGVNPDDAPGNVRRHLIQYGVNPHVFERPEWQFLADPSTARSMSSARPSHAIPQGSAAGALLPAG